MTARRWYRAGRPSEPVVGPSSSSVRVAGFTAHVDEHGSKGGERHGMGDGDRGEREENGEK